MKEQDYIAPIEQYMIDFILELRSKKKLTQQDIANIIGVSRSFIGDVESTIRPTKYNVRHINALADYFGMSPREFLPEKAFPVDEVKEKVVKKKAAAPRKVPVKKVAKKEKGKSKK